MATKTYNWSDVYSPGSIQSKYYEKNVLWKIFLMLKDFSLFVRIKSVIKKFTSLMVKWIKNLEDENDFEKT